MIPLFDSSSVRQQKILGFPMNQNRMAVPTWSYAMELEPPRRIIELGAYNGGFTICLALHVYNLRVNDHRECRIYSYDLCDAPTSHWGRLASELGIIFTTGNVFDNEAKIAALIKEPGPTWLLCDNGSKVKEFNTFAQYLKPGDVIAAHDYFTGPEVWCSSEIFPADVADTVKEFSLEPWLQEHFDLAAWLVYKKKL
jgi:hypothetical protein